MDHSSVICTAQHEWSEADVVVASAGDDAIRQIGPRAGSGRARSPRPWVDTSDRQNSQQIEYPFHADRRSLDAWFAKPGALMNKQCARASPLPPSCSKTGNDFRCESVDRQDGNLAIPLDAE